MKTIMPPINTEDGLFHEGNPSQGTQGTIVTALHLNNQQSATRDVQIELTAILSDAGIIPDGTETTQVLQAIKKIISAHSIDFTPVQQGGGNGMHDNKIYIGLGDNQRLVAQVDATEIGEIYTTNTPPKASETGAFPITGGNLIGGMNALGSVGTQGGAFLIRNDQGEQIASISAGSDGAITVYSDVTGRSFGFDGFGNFTTDAGAFVCELGQRVYSPNNPPPNTMQLSVNGDGWWYRDLRTGMIFQGGFVSGSTSESGAMDRIPLNIAVPNRLLHVSTIIRNFAQGYQTTWNPQTRNLSGEQNGFDWIHGNQEREVYWMAIGY